MSVRSKTASSQPALSVAFDDSNFIISAATVKDVWSKSRPKAALLEFLTLYFKPKSSLDPERVDYNALNILADYQLYNLEFAKNELTLNDKQSACVLNLFWKLLEFDPDRADTSESERHNQVKTETVQFHVENHDSEEDKQLAQLLRCKVDLMKSLIEKVVEHEHHDARITIEQARRMIAYSQRTYFKHLRLYDFVLKNSKTSEKKYIKMPFVEPQVGRSLADAMVLDDGMQEVYFDAEDDFKKPSQKVMAQADQPQTIEEADDSGPVVVSGLEKLDEQEAEHQVQESEVASEMDDMIKTSGLPKESK